MELQTCKCGCFIFDAEAKKCVKCGLERQQPTDKPGEVMTAEEIIDQNYFRQWDDEKDGFEMVSFYKSTCLEMLDEYVSQYKHQAEQHTAHVLQLAAARAMEVYKSSGMTNLAERAKKAILGEGVEIVDYKEQVKELREQLSNSEESLKVAVANLVAVTSGRTKP